MMEQITQLLDLFGSYGVAFLIVALILYFATKYIPKWADSYFEQHKQALEQKEKQQEIQNELVRTVASALEHSNVVIAQTTAVISENTKAIGRNIEMYERTQELIAHSQRQQQKHDSLLYELLAGKAKTM